MSQQNVEVVAGYYEAADLATAIDALADDVTFAFLGASRHLAGAETVSGKQAAVAWLADWFSRFDRVELYTKREPALEAAGLSN